MRYWQIRLGTTVYKTMGVPQKGKVIAPFSGPYTDGQYRNPEKHDRPIYVLWDDGTRGWIQREVLSFTNRSPIEG